MGKKPKKLFIITKFDQSNYNKNKNWCVNEWKKKKRIILYISMY